MSIRERLEREIEKFKQTRGSMPVGVNELLLSDALEEIKRLTASESAPRTLLVADDPNAVACAAIVKLAEEQSRGDKNEWTGEHIEACKRAGWWLQEKSRGLPGYYPSEAMRAFKDGYDAGRSSLSHVAAHSCDLTLHLAHVYSDLSKNSDLEGWQISKVLDAVQARLKAVPSSSLDPVAVQEAWAMLDENTKALQSAKGTGHAGCKSCVGDGPPFYCTAGNECVGLNRAAERKVIPE
jgi:hypothetical protein